MASTHKTSKLIIIVQLSSRTPRSRNPAEYLVSSVATPFLVRSSRLLSWFAVSCPAWLISGSYRPAQKAPETSLISFVDKLDSANVQWHDVLNQRIIYCSRAKAEQVSRTRKTGRRIETESPKFSPLLKSLLPAFLMFHMRIEML